jgi:hypothetical protein
MTLRALVLFPLAVLAVALTAAPAVAAEPGTPVFAASYWDGFLEHWTAVLQKQNGVVMAALLVGALCLFIITRGKWRK